MNNKMHTILSHWLEALKRKNHSKMDHCESLLRMGLSNKEWSAQELFTASWNRFGYCPFLFPLSLRDMNANLLGLMFEVHPCYKIQNHQVRDWFLSIQADRLNYERIHEESALLKGEAIHMWIRGLIHSPVREERLTAILKVGEELWTDFYMNAFKSWAHAVSIHGPQCMTKFPALERWLASLDSYDTFEALTEDFADSPLTIRLAEMVADVKAKKQYQELRDSLINSPPEIQPSPKTKRL